jgi:hypothetical protein
VCHLIYGKGHSISLFSLYGNLLLTLLQTLITISQWATNRDSFNFRDPESFVPERWLGDPYYENDNRTAMQPFHYGPRNCLGKK